LPLAMTRLIFPCVIWIDYLPQC